MQAASARWRERLKRPFFAEDRSTRFLAVAGVIVLIGVLAYGANAHAFGVEDTAKFIINMVGELLNIIIAFLGFLVIQLVNILIFFASYNNFVGAEPVKVGWVLMRDVVNMFFIIILLVSAFSTIIGYKAFHYTGVLPKLLLMAILINFSKTLIGLMIDFSQVIMLTFVSAFKQAAGGNFVEALKLTKITKLDATAPDTYEPYGLIMAALLGIMMLGIAMTLLVIMIAFLVFRIIGLWMLLIMSPMAFFALALPDKLKKGFGAFTGKFWDRLSTLLIAGPVMAFFLWLALAVAQGPGSFASDFSGVDELNSKSENANFVSEVGKPSEIATFIIAVAFMMQGVEFAVSTSKEIGGALGKFATAAAAGGGVAVQLARVGGKAGKLGFEGVDRLADVRGKVGKAGLAASARLGGIGGTTFGALAGYKTGKIKAKQAELLKSTEGLGAAGQDAYLRKVADSSVFTRAASGAQLALADRAKSSLTQKALTDRFDADLKAKGFQGSDAERAAQAEYMAAQRRGADLNVGIGLATEFGNDAKVDDYKEALKKDPRLQQKFTDLADIKNASPEDAKRYLSSVPATAFQSGPAALAHAYALGLIDDRGEEVRNEDTEATWKLIEKGDRGKFYNEGVGKLSAEQRQAQLAAMDKNATPDQITLAEASRTYAAKKDGQIGGVFVNSPNFQTTQTVQNQSVFEEARARADAAAPGSEEAINARTEMLAAGATIPAAFGFSASEGTFESTTRRNEFNESISRLSGDLQRGSPSAVAALEKLDTDTIAANPGRYNEARSAAMANIDLESLKAAYNNGGTEAQAKVKKIMDTFEREASRLESSLKGKVSTEEIAGVASNPSSATSVATVQKIRDAGIVNPVEAAQSIDKGWQIRNQYGALRSNIASRAATSARQAAKDTGAAIQQKTASLRENRARDRAEKEARAAQGPALTREEEAALKNEMKVNEYIRKAEEKAAKQALKDEEKKNKGGT